MATQTTDLLLLEDIQDARRTSEHREERSGSRFMPSRRTSNASSVAPMPVLAIDGDVGFGEHVARAA